YSKAHVAAHHRGASLREVNRPSRSRCASGSTHAEPERRPASPGEVVDCAKLARLQWSGTAWSTVSPRLLVERVLPLVVLGTACVSVPIAIASDSGLPRLERLRRERSQVDEKVSRLSEDIRRLRAEVERIKSDPSHV